MTVGLQQIIPAIEYIGMHYMNPISGEDLASISSVAGHVKEAEASDDLTILLIHYKP